MSKELERHSTNMAIQALRTGLRTLADYIGPKCRNAVEVAMATTANDDAAQHPEQAEDDIKKLIVLLRHGDAMPGEQDLAADHLERLLKAEQAEGAQGEREMFEARYAGSFDLTRDEEEPDDYRNKFVDEFWQGWKARAALAQPSPAPELERPEVVAWSNWKVGTRSHVPFRTEVEAARSVNASEIAATQEGPYSVEPLMTVAQHDRIVGALQRQVSALALGAEQAMEQRDAAQARVAELERQEPALWFWLERGDESNDYARRARYTAKRPTNMQADLGMIPYYAAPVAQAGQVPEALREGFMTSCSGGGKYEVKIQFSNLKDAQESHNFLVKLLAAAPAQGD
ncbi:hypothetical protein [Pseudomonas sp. HS-18]|uniref:hypothetical protein n=1 Tax=Pseudomonas sp. HS-18 TaxID=2879114 RepID=UPI001CF0D4B6|nr:hypothetical protein [Pseudomonas sp. HS-18]UCL84537.1 hypothetical protein LDJ84_16290 [Pseudomonas sp. HS-18]